MLFAYVLRAWIIISDIIKNTRIKNFIHKSPTESRVLEVERIFRISVAKSYKKGNRIITRNFGTKWSLNLTLSGCDNYIKKKIHIIARCFTIQWVVFKSSVTSPAPSPPPPYLLPAATRGKNFLVSIRESPRLVETGGWANAVNAS